MNRRSLLQSLAVLPFLGWLVPAKATPPIYCARWSTAKYARAVDCTLSHGRCVASEVDLLRWVVTVEYAEAT